MDSVTRRIEYGPPGPADVPSLMADLLAWVVSERATELPPVLRAGLLLHRFLSIHPFPDGNGRTGRILNVLYLVQQGLLDIPVLYLSHYIVHTKADYYRLLQTTRTHDTWEDWVLYMLTAVEVTARQTMATIADIRAALMDYKHRIRAGYKFYSQDLINNLFMHPYTKIEFVQRDLKVSRLTATKYMDLLDEGGFVKKQKIGRTNYYVNPALTGILTRQPAPPHD